jgi:cell wall-active antibiotic response 4TMS protein YvqF
MKCATHSEVDSVAFCGQCGRALCAECKHDVKGMVYCENCLAARMQMGSSLPPLLGPGGGPQPGIALLLGFIPGVGAIYNGQILKAMVQVLIFGSLIAISDKVGGPMDTIFGLGAAAFYFYMVIDSYQTARRKLLGQPAEEWLGLGDFKLNAPIGAGLLIALGALFLLDNLGIHVFSHISKFWPVLLIVIGLVLLQRRMGGSHSGGGASTTPPSSSGTGGGSTGAPPNVQGPRGL